MDRFFEFLWYFAAILVVPVGLWAALILAAVVRTEYMLAYSPMHRALGVRAAWKKVPLPCVATIGLICYLAVFA